MADFKIPQSELLKHRNCFNTSVKELEHKFNIFFTVREGYMPDALRLYKAGHPFTIGKVYNPLDARTYYFLNWKQS